MTRQNSQRPLRILLDISPAACLPEARTGLARVAASLATALGNHPDVVLRTCAWGSLQSSLYFADHEPEFRNFQPVPSSVPWLTRGLLQAQRSAASPLRRRLTHRALQVMNRCRNPLAACDLRSIDVAHSTYARLPRALRRQRVPALLTLHDITPLRLPPATFGREQRAITSRLVRSIRRDDWVACVSEFSRRDFITYTGHRADRVRVIPNGVDHSVFKPPADRNASGDLRRRLGLGTEPFALTMSSLAPHKNVAMLCRLWPEVRAAVPNAVLVIAGGKTADLARLRAEAGLSANLGIVATGYVSDADFCNLAASCHAFLFPSTYEGFGLPALEAMAAGAHVIASNTTSLPEVVGRAGALIPPDDPAAWRDAIIGRLLLPQPVEPSAAAIRQAARFSWTAAADAYVDLYRTILRETQPALP